jgi:hypothetical protein
MKFLTPIFFILALGLQGCAGTGALKDATASQTGCESENIQISDDSGNISFSGTRKWKASCDGKTYNCFASGNSWSCKESNTK